MTKAARQLLERSPDQGVSLRAVCAAAGVGMPAVADLELYRLMFSPALGTVPTSAGRVFVLLTEMLERCAVVGALRIPSHQAAPAILSAGTGVALSILSQPDRYFVPELSHRVRDAISPPASPPTSDEDIKGMRTRTLQRTHECATELAVGCSTAAAVDSS